MRLRLVCLLLTLTLMGAEAANLRSQDTLGRNFFKKLKDKVNRHTEEVKLQTKAMRNVDRELEAERSDRVNSELQRLRDEAKKDYGREYGYGAGKSWYRPSKNTLEYKKQKEQNALHSVSDDKLTELKTDLEKAVLTDIDKFVTAVGAY